MTRSTTSKQAIRAAAGFCASALLAVAAATAQVGLTGDTGIDASGDYQQERAWCMANTAGEERVTCLKNSGAAQAETTVDRRPPNTVVNPRGPASVFSAPIGRRDRAWV